MQEIIEYIPNEGEPVLISGPKPLHPPEKQPAPKEDYLLRSMDLDNSFIVLVYSSFAAFSSC